MAITRRKVESHRERRILIAMVMSKDFLSQAVNAMDLELIDTAHYKVVAEWCIDHFKQYGKAPKSHIEDYYHKWSEDNTNTELVDAVRAFLESLSEEQDKAKGINVPYMCDQLAQFITKRRVIRVKESIEHSTLEGNFKEAEQSIVTYKMTTVGHEDGSDALNDDAVWDQSFTEARETVIPFEGDAGKFFNYAMTRGSLIAIQAPEKCGKSWWCIEFAMRALRHRKKVAFFEVGDLLRSELYVRFGMRYTKRPQWQRQCGRILVPSHIEVDDNESCGYRVDSKVIEVKHTVTKESSKRGRTKFQRACGHSPDVPYFMTSTHPNSSINVQGISNILDMWKSKHDFHPDVIVIDYSDILAPENTGRKHEQDRNVVNDTWKALRRLSQERHALVITPTQAKADSYNVTNEPILQTMKSFSDDKRKLAHVTGMIGLNQTPEEKEMQGMRLNWIVLRGAPYNITKPLYVGTCFPLARALCCASF